MLHDDSRQWQCSYSRTIPYHTCTTVPVYSALYVNTNQVLPVMRMRMAVLAAGAPRPSHMAKMLLELKRHIQQTYPYWNRTQV